MKKAIIFFLILVSVLSNISPYVLAANNCPPHQTGLPLSSYAKYIGNPLIMRHARYTYGRTICVNCYVRIDVLMDTITQDCTRSIMSNLGHSGNKHTIQYRCVCGNTYTPITYNCPGGSPGISCIFPMSLPLIES